MSGVIDRCGTDLFGRHVAGRPHDCSNRRGTLEPRVVCGGHARRFNGFGQAEVEDLDPSVACDEQVFGLDVAVDDTAGVPPPDQRPSAALYRPL